MTTMHHPPQTHTRLLRRRVAGSQSWGCRHVLLALRSARLCGLSLDRRQEKEPLEDAIDLGALDRRLHATAA